MAEYASLSAVAEAEAYRVQHDALLAVLAESQEEDRRWGADVAHQRSVVRANEQIATDKALLRLSHTPDGARAIAEAQNSLNTATSELAIIAKHKDAAYFRFVAADRALKQFERQNGVR